MVTEGYRKFLYNLQKAADYVEKIIEWMACALLVVIAFAVVASVFTRNLNIPVVWLGELGAFSFVWVTFLSMALAYRHNLIPSVEIINHLLSGKAAQWLSLLLELISIAFLAIVMWSASEFMAYLGDSGHISAELRVPMVYVYIGLMLGYIFTLFFSFVKMCEKITELKHPELSIDKEVQI